MLALALLAGVIVLWDRLPELPTTSSSTASRPAAPSTHPASPSTGSASPSDPASPSAEAAPPSAQTASPGGHEAPPPAPEVGRCYQLDWEEVTAPTSDAQPVPCSRAHTAQTFHVGTLDLVVDGHLLAVDSAHAQRQVTRTCARRFARYVGGDAERRRLSRLHAVWFSPTLAESDQGATWFRCDAVALAAPRTLAKLPRSGGLEGVLDQERGANRFGLCGTAAPGDRGFERVICARRHTWKALATIRVPGGAGFPGVSAVRRAGEDTCRELVRERSGSPLRFQYGWEWPTREQWREGRRFGYCWAPS